MHKGIHPRLSPSSWWAQHRSKKKHELKKKRSNVSQTCCSIRVALLVHDMLFEFLTKKFWEAFKIKAASSLADVRSEILGMVPHMLDTWYLVRIYEGHVQNGRLRTIFTEKASTMIVSCEASHNFWQKNDGQTIAKTIHRPLRFSFFCLDAAWLNEIVVRAVALLSATTKWKVAKATSSKAKKEQHQPRCSLPESAGGG